VRTFVPSYGHYGLSDYDKYEAEFQKYLKLMWQTPLGDPRREAYEKKANEAKAKQQATGGGGTDIFSAGASAEKLWGMPYSQRLVDVSGVLLPGEATIIAIAKGMQPSFATTALENRGVIKGGLAALFMAGLTEANPEGLFVGVTSSRSNDDLLVRAAGLTPTGNVEKDLSKAAEKVRKEVSKQGANLRTLAWGLRGGYILSTLKGFQAFSALVSSAGGIAAGVVTGTIAGAPAGVVIGVATAVWAAMSGISIAIAENVAAQMNSFIKQGTDGYAAELVAKAAEAQRKAASRSAASRGASRGRARRPEPKNALQDALDDIPTWGWVAGGAALLVGGYLLLRE
jgi:hypothetical protein